MVLIGSNQFDDLLEALDETPSTPSELAARLDWETDQVKQGLAELEEEGQAVDWGGIWATTWRAKTRLAPGFFRIWVPGSLALGLGFTALALALNGPAGLAAWVPIGLAILAVAALAWGLFPVAEDGL